MKNPQFSIENRLSDSPSSRFWQELFRNSGQFPIAIILLEFLKEGFNYLSKPDLYILLPASAVQSYFLARRPILSARDLRESVMRSLLKRELGAGIGIHTGSHVEGLLGGQKIRFYDVIGDTVNTASRIEKNSSAGEIWISEDTRLSLTNKMAGDQKEIEVKGKNQPIKVYSI